MTLSLPLLLLAALVVFLGILGGLAVAVTKTVNPDGRMSRGVFGALASAFSLVFLCGLGLVGTGGFLAALAVGTAVDQNPIESIEIRRDRVDDGAGLASWHQGHDSVTVLFSMRGDGGEHLESFLENVLGLSERELASVLTVHRHDTLTGEPLELYELELPLSDRELAAFERDVERELDGLRIRLPESVAIHFEGAERF